MLSDEKIKDRLRAIVVSFAFLVLVIGFVLVTTNKASAATVTATWVEPTKLTNGSPLDKSLIYRYGLRYVNTLTGTSRMRYPKANTTSYILTVDPGTYRIDMRTYLLDGRRSDWSGAVTVRVE